jgi:release factor glutamine methyltransferase
LTIVEILKLSAEYLQKHGSDSPRLDAELLLAHALGLRRLDLYLRFDHALVEPQLSAYRALVARRGKGDPVAYLVGHREFMGLDFEVTPDVLVPNPDTEVLVQRAVAIAREQERPLRVADVGTGSGCIATALATELPTARIIASDVSPRALAVARRNVLRHGVADRIELRAGDLLAPVAERVEAVVANLPYLTTAEVDAGGGTSLEFEPRAALDGGEDGLDVIRRAIGDLPTHLAPGGVALFECAPAQARAVAILMRRTLHAKTAVERDLAGRDRVVAGVRS